MVTLVLLCPQSLLRWGVGQGTDLIQLLNRRYEEIPRTSQRELRPTWEKIKPYGIVPKGEVIPSKPPSPFTARAECLQDRHLPGRMKGREEVLLSLSMRTKNFCLPRMAVARLARLRCATPARSSLSRGFYMARKAELVKTSSKPRLAKERNFLPMTASRSMVAQEGPTWQHQGLRDGPTCPWAGCAGTLWHHLNQNPALRFPTPGDEQTTHNWGVCYTYIRFQKKRLAQCQSLTMDFPRGKQANDFR